MAVDSSRTSGVADRYAGALFELGESQNQLDTIEQDLARFDELLQGSDDLMRLVRSPAFSAEEQASAITAVVDRAGITGLVGNFLKVVASNRRLFAVPGMIRAFRAKLADHRGEVSAEVSVAHELSGAQEKELTKVLKGIVGKDIALDITVDPSLLGGMVVKVGSRQIDTSLRTRLDNMKLALKATG